LDKFSLSIISAAKFGITCHEYSSLDIGEAFLGRLIQHGKPPAPFSGEEDTSWIEIKQGFEFLNQRGEVIPLGETFHLKRWCKQALLRCVEIWGYVEPDMLLRGLNGNDRMRKTIGGLLGVLNRVESLDRGCLHKDTDGRWHIADSEAFNEALQAAGLQPLSAPACAAARQVAQQMRSASPPI
jgi:hypothetical protein